MVDLASELDAEANEDMRSSPVLFSSGFIEPSEIP